MKPKKILLAAALLVIFCCQFSIVQAQVVKTQNEAEAEDTTAMPLTGDTLAEPNTTYGYALRARAYGDSIVLRWAVDNSGAWLTANHYGWRVFRSGDEGDGFIEVSDSLHPIKPMTLDEMKRTFSKDNKMAGLAAQALYGRNFNPDKVSVSTATNEQGMANAIFRQYQEQTQRQIFAYMAAETDPMIAQALGMRFVDRTVKKGVFYTYYLQPVYESELYVIGLSTVSLENVKFERGITEQMPEVDVVQVQARECVVRWEKNELSGYYVERSLDGGKHWADVSHGVPSWPMPASSDVAAVYGDSIAAWMNSYVLFFDTLPMNVTAVYRVRGFDAFGEKTPWQESAEFRLQDVTPPTPPAFTYIEPVDNKYCIIKWDTQAYDADLKGFFLVFSESLAGPWDVASQVLGKEQREYVDSLAGQRGRGYYRLFAVDTAGNTSYSVAAINHIEDILPPKKPTGLTAVADTNGYVYLSWNKSKERDLQGYKLLFANDPHHEFIPVFSVYTRDDYYIDTIDIKSLTRYGYYTLMAVDKNNNVSEYSDTIAVLLPDVVPPTGCVLEHFVEHQDSVEIYWYRSSSDDVERYLVYRKPRGAVAWENIATFPPDVNRGSDVIRFVDRPAPSEKMYTYSIETLDSAGNSSGRTAEFSVRVSGSNLVPLNIDLKVEQVKKSSHVKLEWNFKYDGKREPRGVIYRSVENGPFEVVSDFNDQSNTYIDRTVPAGAKASYYIVVEFGNGKYSQPSKIVTVKAGKGK